MNTRKPDLEIHGPVATHDVPCAVFWLEQPAVYDLNEGVFRPSWAARSKGWELVHANNWLRRAILRMVFAKHV